MKLHSYILIVALALVFSSCLEEDSIKEPDYEVGIIANATLEPEKYWFNI